MGVLRQGDTLLPVMRKGYDVRTSPYSWLQSFAGFVQQNQDRFLSLLSDGEGVCGEWMIKTHTLSYDMPHEPFICFDIINGTCRERFDDLQKRLREHGFTCVGLVHDGSAITTAEAMRELGRGFHWVIGQPEGVVYRYENVERGWMFNAKFVSNPLIDNEELFKQNTEGNIINTWHIRKQGSSDIYN